MFTRVFQKQLFACLLSGSVFLFFLAETAAQKKPTSAPVETTVAPKNAAENLSGTDVYYYYLRLWIDINKKTIGGSNAISFKALVPTDSFVIDLFSQYKVSGVLYNGKWLKQKRAGNKITVYFPETLPKDSKTTIQIHYEGVPQTAKKAPWDGGFIWEKDSLRRDWVTVACEQLGASSWWPCKDDAADEPDSVRLLVNVPRGMFCVSNGQFRHIFPPEDDKYTAFDWTATYPINLYNVTLNIGYYDRIRDYYTSERKDSTGKNISYLVDYFFLDYHSDRAKAFFADTIYARTKTMLKCYEKLFGVYPFARDGYALVETPYWGMEHQSAVAYGNNFKLNNFGFDFILIHESAHEWWGNAVSCNDPADMWIHESFTTYTEALFVEYLYGYKRSLEYLSMQKPNIANKTPIQGPRGVNFHERADNDIYYKGSWMLHTLRSVLDNDSLWFGMLYGLQQEFKYKTISTEDVTKYIEKYTNRNLEAFFRQYIYGNKLPTLQYFVEKKNGKNVLKYRWINAVTGFEMPIDIYVKDKKYRLIPKSTYQTLNVENDAIKVNTERFLIEVLNQK